MAHQVKIFYEYFNNRLFKENLDTELQVLQALKQETISQSFNQTSSQIYLHDGNTFGIVAAYQQVQRLDQAHPANQSTRVEQVLNYQRALFLN